MTNREDRLLSRAYRAGYLNAVTEVKANYEKAIIEEVSKWKMPEEALSVLKKIYKIVIYKPEFRATFMDVNKPPDEDTACYEKFELPTISFNINIVPKEKFIRIFKDKGEK